MRFLKRMYVSLPPATTICPKGEVQEDTHFPAYDPNGKSHEEPVKLAVLTDAKLSWNNLRSLPFNASGRAAYQTHSTDLMTAN
jgi:hypothetical protein